VWNVQKLTSADRAKAVLLHDSGLTVTALAKRFGVSTATISRTINEKPKPAKPGGWGQREGWGEV